MSTINPISNDTPISTPSAPATPTSTSLVQFFYFPDLLEELKVRIFSFLSRVDLQNVSLVSRNFFENAQLALMRGLAKELTQFNISLPTFDRSAFNRKMEILSERKPYLALTTCREIQSTPANNQPEVLGHNLLLACRSVQESPFLTDDEKIEALTDVALTVYDRMPARPPIPMNETQMIISHADTIIKNIFRTLTKIDVDQAIYAALNKLPVSKLSDFGLPVQVLALNAIASECLNQKKPQDVLKIARILSKLESNVIGINYLLKEVCASFVRENNLEEALKVAEEYSENPSLYQDLRNAIIHAFVAKGDYRQAVEMFFEPDHSAQSMNERVAQFRGLINALTECDNDAAKQIAGEAVQRMLPVMCANPSFSFDYHLCLLAAGTAAELLAYAKHVSADEPRNKLTLLKDAAEQIIYSTKSALILEEANNQYSQLANMDLADGSEKANQQISRHIEELESLL